MFGYININKDELKGKHLRLYKDYYCALCTQLKKECGSVYRMLTSYDVTFFLIIFDYISNDKTEMPIVCPLNKKRNKNILISKSAMDFSILINLFWTVEKLNDDIIDEKKIIYRLIYKIIKRNKGIKEIYSNILVNNWEEKLKEFYISEKNNEPFDIITNKIGAAYGTVFEDYISFSEIDFDKRTAYEIGYQLGKYIYIMDAYDDYNDDIKKSKFNPITNLSNYEEIKSTYFFNVKIQSIICFIISRLNDDFLKYFSAHGETYHVIENVVKFGLTSKLIDINKKNYEKGNNKDEHNN